MDTEPEFTQEFLEGVLVGGFVKKPTDKMYEALLSALLEMPIPLSEASGQFLDGLLFALNPEKEE